MQEIFQTIDAWYNANQTAIIGVVVIIAVALLVKSFGHRIISKIVRRSLKTTAHTDRREEAKREKTIEDIIGGALMIIIWPIAIILIISQMGVNIAPFIAGAGVVGLAVGFGAQSLVKDFISGMFIIAENQYRVGDVVDLDGQTIGLVERVTLRSTVLRDLDGVVHTVPNGSIERTSNYSKDFSGINLNVGVSYGSDLDRVINVVNKVCEELGKDKDWSDKILETPEFKRVDNFGDNSIDIKITGRVMPLEQWGVTGELRKRLKIAFDREGIEIPFPQRTVHMAKG